jgi:hypothetical protein
VLFNLYFLVPGFANHWIGASDLGIEDTWFWSGTGQRVVYTNWRVGEPGHVTTENAAYLGWADDQVQWFDSNELDRRYLICEETCTNTCLGTR